ncbi:MAG: hypothetical protein PVG45_01805 [Gammaproteobacteria bacterium]|jgi:hypothetical protein
MPHLDDNSAIDNSVDGKQLATLAESLYVANLLIIPFLGFIILGFIYLKKHGDAPPLAQSHLEQTIAASIGIAIVFIAFAGMIMLLRVWGLEAVAIWVIVVIVFTIIHATMVLFGVLGLARAMAGKCWRYPVFGRDLPDNCPQ